MSIHNLNNLKFISNLDNLKFISNYVVEQMYNTLENVYDTCTISRVALETLYAHTFQHPDIQKETKELAINDDIKFNTTTKVDIKEEKELAINDDIKFNTTTKVDIKEEKELAIIDGIIDDIKFSILTKVDIRQLMIMKQVSKRWLDTINEKTIWQMLGKQLQLPEIQSYQENAIRYIFKIKNQAKICFPNIFDDPAQLDVEIRELCASYRIEDINTLAQACRARDVIIVWGALKRQAPTAATAPRIDDIQSVKDLISKIDDFKIWFSNHQGVLSQIRELDLSHNQLFSLPTEIGQLAQLERLYFSYNQRIYFPTEFGLLSGRLDQLEMFGFSYNRPSFLPAEIVQLFVLGKLKLYRQERDGW